MTHITDFEEPHQKKAHKSWIFTLNNYTEPQCEYIKGLEGITKMAVGREVGESGTPHLQGVMTWKAPKRFTQLSKLIPTAHWEKCKDIDMAFNYCRKELNMLCDINNSKQGKRSDLEEAVDAVKAGNTEQQLWSDHSITMVRHHRGLLALAKALKPPVSYPLYTDILMPLYEDWTKSLIISGDPGVGKTRWAEQHFPGGFLHASDINDLAKFNPDIHTGILFDDMSFTHIPRTCQIHLVDVDDPRSIRILYGTASIPRNTKKIFTTNNLREIFNLEDEAIRRRVTVTEVVKGNTKLSPKLRYLESADGKHWHFPADY